MKRSSVLVFALLALLSSTPAIAADPPAPYTEGSVWKLDFIHVKYGMSDDYLRSLSATWKKGMDEAVKQNLILSYKILRADAASPQDWNLILLVELKNMAALDGLDEKMRVLQEKIIGGEEMRKNIVVKRVDVREVLGSRLARELILK